MSTELLCNPATHGIHAHCPTLCSLASGEQVAVWYSYPDKETRDARLVFAACDRQGQWQRPRSLLAESQYSYGNPVIYEEKPGVLALLFVALRGNYWDAAVLRYTCSSDGGVTWANPVDLHLAPGIMVRHPPIRRGDAFLLPAYDEKRGESLLLSGQGPVWREQYRFSGLPLIQPALVSDPGSEGLTLFFRPMEDPRILWRSRSTDAGRNWCSPIQTPLPCALSGFAACASRDRVFVIYNHTRKHERTPLSVSHTLDLGVTWSEPRHIDLAAKELSYPSFNVLPDDTVSGVYTYGRQLIKHVAIPIAEFL